MWYLAAAVAVYCGALHHKLIDNNTIKTMLMYNLSYLFRTLTAVARLLKMIAFSNPFNIQYSISHT